jgi:hypothetical protein
LLWVCLKKLHSIELQMKYTGICVAMKTLDTFYILCIYEVKM